MIDQTVFNNKKAAYYTLGCKLNFAETSTIGKLLAEQGVRKVRPGEKADMRGEYLLRNGTSRQEMPASDSPDQ